MKVFYSPSGFLTTEEDDYYRTETDRIQGNWDTLIVPDDADYDEIVDKLLHEEITWSKPH